MPKHKDQVTIVGKKSASTIRKKLALVLLALLIFVAGVQTGKGNLMLRSSSAQNKGLPANLDYTSVEQVYDELRSKYDGKLDVNKLMDGLKQGLVAASGDPYTEYMTKDEAQQFNSQLSGSFDGIGAELGKDANSNIIIVSPIAGTPAAKADLRAKDIIEKIDGTSTAGMSTDTAVDKIRGTKGTKVTLTIIRDQQELTKPIIRDTITVPSVESKILGGSIGYMQISRFGSDTGDLAKKAADNFKQQNVKGVILDLRGNPGGYLDAAVAVSSLWLNNKTILTERRDGVVEKTYTSDGENPLLGIPTIVLINDGSASASEITAGALHDNHAATLLGVTSFGKGSVQEPEDLADGSLLKITIAHWYTPDGKNINKQGIAPDQKVERSDDDIKNGKDPQLDAAQAKLQAK